MVVLLPFLIAVTLTVYWWHSISNPWLYGVIGIVVAYAVAIAVGWVSERYELSVRGHVGGSYFFIPDDATLPNQVQSPKSVPRDTGPMFEPLSVSWFGLLIAIVLLCVLALWGLKGLFRIGAP